MAPVQRGLTLLALLLGPLLASCDSRCVGSIEQVGAWCPKTFDGTAEQLPPCMHIRTTVRICGGLILLSHDGGFTGETCAYDWVSHQLVGADMFSDTPEFCDNSSLGIQAGKVVDPRCRSSAPILLTKCSVR